MNPTRRRFLQSSALAATSWSLPLPARAASAPENLRIALITDVHQDVIHDAADRLRAFITQATAWQAHAVMELGDFCIPKPANRPFADIFESFPGKRFHVLGNHDMDDGFTREQAVAFHRMPCRYHSFDLGGIHGVILDGNDTPPGHQSGYPSHIADDQIDWLRDDLAKTELPVFIFSHQSLERPNCIRSQEKVRAVLESARRADGSRKVAACLNGHWHINHSRGINGIPYIHLNSASYYWVGSKFARERLPAEIHTRHPHLAFTAPYQKPLFTLLEVDFTKRRFTLAASQSTWLGPSPQEIGAGYPGIDPAWVTPRISAADQALA